MPGSRGVGVRGSLRSPPKPPLMLIPVKAPWCDRRGSLGVREPPWSPEIESWPPGGLAGLTPADRPTTLPTMDAEPVGLRCRNCGCADLRVV